MMILAVLSLRVMVLPVKDTIPQGYQEPKYPLSVQLGGHDFSQHGVKGRGNVGPMVILLIGYAIHHPTLADISHPSRPGL